MYEQVELQRRTSETPTQERELHHHLQRGRKIRVLCIVCGVIAAAIFCGYVVVLLFFDKWFGNALMNPFIVDCKNNEALCPSSNVTYPCTGKTFACWNDDDCVPNTDVCGVHGRCLFRVHVYLCVCDDGYETNNEGLNCECRNGNCQSSSVGMSSSTLMSSSIASSSGMMMMSSSYDPGMSSSDAEEASSSIASSSSVYDSSSASSSSVYDSSSSASSSSTDDSSSSDMMSSSDIPSSSAYKPSSSIASSSSPVSSSGVYVASSSETSMDTSNSGTSTSDGIETGNSTVVGSSSSKPF